MQRNTKVIAAVGLIPEPRELRAVCRGRVFLDNIKGLAMTNSHRIFKATLEIDGSITIDGHSWGDGFPSYALAAIRNLAEGRKLLDPVKPTGGWPYWHYFDETTHNWENSLICGNEPARLAAVVLRWHRECVYAPHSE